jgi:hypothetical protein
MIKYILNFWLDYSVSMYNQLKKHENEPEIRIILETSFIQSLNINTILLILLKVVNCPILDIRYFLITVVLLFIINYLKYNSLDLESKIFLKKRIPKYKRIVYTLFSFLSAVIFFIFVVLSSSKY